MRRLIPQSTVYKLTNRELVRRHMKAQRKLLNELTAQTQKLRLYEDNHND